MSKDGAKKDTSARVREDLAQERRTGLEKLKVNWNVDAGRYEWKLKQSRASEKNIIERR